MTEEIMRPTLVAFAKVLIRRALPVLGFEIEQHLIELVAESQCEALREPGFTASDTNTANARRDSW
jgi:hypothetical protein